jgi:hypothetical protein
MVSTLSSKQEVDCAMDRYLNVRPFHTIHCLERKPSIIQRNSNSPWPIEPQAAVFDGKVGATFDISGRLGTGLRSPYFIFYQVGVG